MSDLAEHTARVLRAALLAGLAAAGVGAAEAQQAPAVTVALVEQRDITPASTFTGRVESVDDVELRARVEGFLEQRLFTEGDSVRVGDLLFTIEKGQYEAAVARAQGNVARAEAALKNAELQLARANELVKNKNIPQATRDDRQADRDAAVAELAAQKAALQTAQLDLGYTDIKAPIAGRIGRSNFSVGSFVGPQSGTLATIVSQDPMYVAFPVTQRQLLAVRKDAAAGSTDPSSLAVKIRLADGTLYDQVGRFNFVDVQFNAGTDTVQVRATMPNPQGLLVDGQLVTVVVETAKPEAALVIPQQAVQIDQAGRYVLKVDAESKVQVQRITVGAERDGQYVVTNGLTKGERVITEGLQKVRPGMAVDAAEARGAPAG